MKLLHNNVQGENTMSSYTHFILSERKYLQELLSKGYSMRKIAAFLDRSPSSISREINRNKAKYKPHRKSDNQYWYNSWRAETLSKVRRREHIHWRLNPDTEEWDYIVEKLNLFWSPEEIAERWKLEHPNKEVFGISTIYRAVKRKAFTDISPQKNFRRRGKRILPKSVNYNTIQPERIIPEWTDCIKERQRIGDWEGDTVYGGVGKGLIVTQVDRKTRFLRAGLLNSRNSKETKAVIVNLLKDIPVHSISLDNGSEFSEFKKIEKELNTEVYFAEPHKPWQRGTNENTNDILRFFFPKGFDFHSITQDDLDFVVDLINNRPRKCLKWHTPAEVFYDESVALA